MTAEILGEATRASEVAALERMYRMQLGPDHQYLKRVTGLVVDIKLTAADEVDAAIVTDGGDLIEVVEDEASVDETDEDQPAREPEVDVRTEDLVRIYLRSIGRVPLLTKAQEIELGKRIEKGRKEEGKSERERDEALVDDGITAKKELANANLRLVVSIAKKMTGQGVSFLDLIQEGNLALYRKAVEKYNHKLGNKFSTHATIVIRQAMQRAIENQARTIRVPVHEVEVIDKIKRTQRDKLQELGREPTTEEIAAALGITPDEVEESLSFDRDPFSLEYKLEDDEGGGTEFGDLLASQEPSQEEYATHGERYRLFAALFDAAELNADQRTVVAYRLGLVDGRQWEFEKIRALIRGVSRNRIGQIFDRAIALMEEKAADQLLNLIDFVAESNA
ncbi:MAG TPA: sigma-70 family RNA polymerase sigma factor [Candidatus Saccharimonadales bacterium]|nr:sigma-70 family RNA polymerase sigma factor [Candidatus Saccharimonadales bacterium]